jgi:hypothetical protein
MEYDQYPVFSDGRAAHAVTGSEMTFVYNAITSDMRRWFGTAPNMEEQEEGLLE